MKELIGLGKIQHIYLTLDWQVTTALKTVLSLMIKHLLIGVVHSYLRPVYALQTSEVCSWGFLSRGHALNPMRMLRANASGSTCVHVMVHV